MTLVFPASLYQSVFILSSRQIHYIFCLWFRRFILVLCGTCG